ncbi:uncharacterized protein BDW70DRAFT_154465 [Aspergillus foveolatus]|uniref:uncharacterized protein n=1 Tax=Aspergillus foveolatus TaxID=210207 RepID=UPI003CCE4AC8
MAADKRKDIFVPKQLWARFIWDMFDKSPEERRLLSKLDAALLTFASLATFGCAIGKIPSNLLLTRIRLRYWLPSMELSESTFYPGMQYSSAHVTDGLAKQSCIFQTGGAIANMLSGPLMGGLAEAVI